VLISAIEAMIPMAAGMFVSIVGFSGAFESARWRMLKRLKYLGPALILFAVFTFVRGIGAENAIDLPRVAAQVRQRINPPVMIDSETRLDTVEAVGRKELAFVFTLVNQASDSSTLPALTDQIRKGIEATSCQNRDWLTYLNAGVAITSRYLTNDGKEAVAVTTSTSDCGL